ncbi:MAG: hypothetical protein EOO88_45105, partial [Pedobacter sp.]
MNDEELKSLWKSSVPESGTEKDILLQLQDNQHPVLRSIRNQLVIELIGWTAFLACYYSMFDGAAKPLYVNGILIISLLAPFFHNIYGYQLTKIAVDASSLLESINRNLKRFRVYAVISIISRIVFTSGFLLFLTYNIDFTSSKRYMLAVLV